MNYRVSTAFSRVTTTGSFAVEKGGTTVHANVFPSKTLNMKKGVLDVIAKSLRVAKQYVSHEDTMFIEVQNQHLCEWLSGLVEYKDYAEELDEVFSVLESIDCRYRFIYVKEPYAKSLMKKVGYSSISGGSLIDAINELEKE